MTMPPRGQHAKAQETPIAASPTSQSFQSTEQESAPTLSKFKGKAKAKTFPLDADGNEIDLVGNSKDGTVVPLALLRSVYLNEPFGRDKIASESDRHVLYHSAFPRRSSSSVVDLDLSELWSEALAGSTKAKAVVYCPASSFVRFFLLLLIQN
jgi:hypothetical protein